MRWNPVLVSSLILLAGCTTPAAAPAGGPGDGVLHDGLEATATTGIIRGVVVDETVAPVANATVKIPSIGRETTVDENGAFGFDRLDPGSFFLSIEKLGYQSQQASAVVIAGVGEPDMVRIQLLRDPLTTPYVVPFQFTGFLRCSLSYIALCGALPDETGDSFMVEFPLTSQPDWINMEAVWDGTQPTGDQMNLNMGTTPAGPATTCCSAQGPSPLLTQANKTAILEYGIGLEKNLIGRMFAWEMEGTGIDDHTGMCIPLPGLTTYCQGPGMALDQEFELFAHVFYHYAPPPEWRFTDDPTVPQP